ncbi:hypothetical protein M408DRAFT_330805 [Serendipita vermifera MAFF 305830]|uniref:Uncharacterized protein n=1 Tax=Serendipita vermifera MAFF 305830 TaxID=933852 RepID=A0A0C3B3D4_SERVB|nr:hypothetical protein M408DRAFT_330805 [Serendipita vermifera MAFF 305830]
MTKKMQAKKAKRMQSVILGEDPAKTFTDDTLRSSTLDAAYTQLLTGWEESASLHSTYSQELANGIAEELRKLEKKKEETKRNQMQFYAKLLSERDRLFADRAKSQQKYYDECGEVEAARQKQERSSAHDRHSERIARQYEQQKNDMLNSKNNYIVSIAMANKIKSKLYESDIPELEDQFQDVQANLIARLVEILAQTQSFTLNHLASLTTKNDLILTAVNNVDIIRDQNLFITFNLRHFTPPPDWKFEVCASYYDKPNLNVEPAPKVFLQNKLSKAEAKLKEAKEIVQTKEQEANANRVRIPQEKNDEKTDKYLEGLHQVTLYKTSVALLEKELEVIRTALGDDIGAQQPHNFKSSSFSIPTTCEYCHSSIWGLAKQGKTCKQCGISVHTKCEMKMPAECTGTKPGHTHTRSSLSLSKLEAFSESKMLSPTPKTAITPSAATPSSFTTTAPPPQHEEHPTIWATVVFDFVASSPFEISVNEGTRVKVMEEDDGSGWIKIFKESTETSGLVPASYLKLDKDEDSDDETMVEPNLSMPIPGALPTQRSNRYVVALYDYEAQGDDELPLVAGERVELSGGENGGDRYGEGWWEGFNSHGRLGIFPSNYVQHI